MCLWGCEKSISLNNTLKNKLSFNGRNFKNIGINLKLVSIGKQITSCFENAEISSVSHRHARVQHVCADVLMRPCTRKQTCYQTCRPTGLYCTHRLMTSSLWIVQLQSSAVQKHSSTHGITRAIYGYKSNVRAVIWGLRLVIPSKYHLSCLILFGKHVVNEADITMRDQKK